MFTPERLQEIRDLLKCPFIGLDIRGVSEYGIAIRQALVDLLADRDERDQWIAVMKSPHVTTVEHVYEPIFQPSTPQERERFALLQAAATVYPFCCTGMPTKDLAPAVEGSVRVANALLVEIELRELGPR